MGVVEELQVSERTGMWGYRTTAPATSFTFPDVVRAQVSNWAARTWTVTLTAFVYGGGDIAGIGNVVPQPGASTGAVAPNDNRTSSARQLIARVTWGVGNASESALVDYPARGCSFAVQASMLSVGILTPTDALIGEPVPIIGAMVSPSARSAPGPIAHPTYTYDTNLIPAATRRYFPVPARAVAYRVYTKDILDFQTITANVGQWDATTGNQVKFDSEAVTSFPQGDPSFPTQENQAGYQWLHRSAQFVGIQNTGLTPVALGLQFLLDLG